MVNTTGPARGTSALLTSGRIPDGGALEVDLPRPAAGPVNELLLREPDLGTAARIVAVIDSALGAKGQAIVVDPGAVRLTLKDTTAGLAATLAKIRDLHVRPARAARIVIDSREGTIVAGGDLVVGEAVVSHAGITLSIGTAGADTSSVRNDLRVPAGSSVQKIAGALHAVQATGSQMAAIFEALREVGAISAEVVVR
jgi:flagellar P-ring protein precursor FlgI